MNEKPRKRARRIPTGIALPHNLPQRMLSREAAAYAGVSPTTLDKGIDEGIYPHRSACSAGF